MIEELGGPNLPAFGFAMGLERMLLALGPTEARPTPTCAVLTVGHRAGPAAAHLATALRSRGVRVDLDARDNSPKSKLRRINSLGIPVALILGDSEIDRGVVQLKNLALGTQEECVLAEAAAKVQAQLTSLPNPGQKPTPQVSEPQV
jgi:histidyl-tRNA synthetase